MANSRTSTRPRSERLIRAVLTFGVAVPLLVLGVFAAGSHAVGVDFGTVVFWFTGFAVLAGLLLAGWGRRMDAADPRGELLRNSATAYGREVSAGSYQRLPLPARLLLVLAGTVVIGWLLLVLSLRTVGL